MARINIEDSIFTKKKWFDLILKTGDPDTALGALLRAFMIAQKYWVPEQKKIPLEVWEEEGLNEALIETKWARRDEDGVYISGSEKQFAWLLSKHENGGKGGRPKKKTGSNPKESKGTGYNPEKPKETEENLKKPKETESHKSAENSDLGFDQKPSYSISYSSSKENKYIPSDADFYFAKTMAQLWNENCGGLGKVSVYTNSEIEKLKELAEFSSDLDYWKKVIKKIAESPFCNGEGKDGWQASFSWFLKPDSHVKVMDGTFDNRRRRRSKRRRKIAEEELSPYV